MRCKLCQSDKLSPLPFTVPDGVGLWVRCADCGSDSATHNYDQVKSLYNPEYLTNEVINSGGKEARRKEVVSNCDWFPHHHLPELPKTFLDIGCLDGAALLEMQEVHGYEVHGFDVIQPPYTSPVVTVRPFFSEWWFGGDKFATVLAREVFEHLPTPELFLHQCFYVTMLKGLFQIQTPKPTNTYNPIGYQLAHLHLPSPNQLTKMLTESMFEVLDSREWVEGQAYLCRAKS